MWGGKKAREKSNLDDVEIDEYDEQGNYSSGRSSGIDYSENDVWHMLYGIRESYMDASVSVNSVNVRKWTDGSFDITLSVDVEYHSCNSYSQDYIEKCIKIFFSINN